jgi:hypothetical protein
VQPLLVTGRPSAGTFVFIRYVDKRHVCIGVDVWGLFGKVTEPIETDYYAVHKIEISEGALFPLNHPAIHALTSAGRETLRRRLRVVLDGRVILNEAVQPYDTRLSEITVGENHIGGSLSGVRFTGEILGIQRGPVQP